MIVIDDFYVAHVLSLRGNLFEKKNISNVESLAVSSRFYLANYTWLSISFVYYYSRFSPAF